MPQPFFIYLFIYLLFGSFLTSNRPTTCDICMRTLMIVIIIIASGGVCVCVFSVLILYGHVYTAGQPGFSEPPGTARVVEFNLLAPPAVTPGATAVPERERMQQKSHW